MFFLSNLVKKKLSVLLNHVHKIKKKKIMILEQRSISSTTVEAFIPMVYSSTLGVQYVTIVCQRQ